MKACQWGPFQDTLECLGGLWYKGLQAGTRYIKPPRLTRVVSVVQCGSARLCFAAGCVG